MAAVASSSSYHAFAPSISQSSSSSQFQNQNAHDGESFDENLVNTLFCKALYDYEAQDPSALSFKRGDIIEVLTQQPSGWWDGLLGDERGWFPSNYVEVISDEEAEVALSGGLSDLDQHSIDQQSLAPSSSMSQASSMPRMASDADSGMVDMSHAMLGGGAHLDADELEDEFGGAYARYDPRRVKLDRGDDWPGDADAYGDLEITLMGRQLMAADACKLGVSLRHRP